VRHLDPEPKEVHDVGMGSTPKPLRCRIGIHRWQTLKNPETKEPYVSCERCHKDNEKLSLVPIEGRTNWPGASY
jgi:hypothetical protein